MHGNSYVQSIVKKKKKKILIPTTAKFCIAHSTREEAYNDVVDVNPNS